MQSGLSYPPEYLIRLLKGKYPKWDSKSINFKNSRILDVGCGDGRTLPLYIQCNFKEIFATEISDTIIKQVKHNLTNLKISKDNIKVGFNNNLPFKDSFFDVLVSWNSSYYMSSPDYDKHLREYYRVLSTNSFIICSIPTSTNFIFRNCKPVMDGYVEITDDYFDGMRNGQLMRIFRDKTQLLKIFSQYFNNLVIGEIKDDCFGLNYHWYILIGRKA